MTARRSLHWLGIVLVLLSLGLLVKGLARSGKEVTERISDLGVLALTIGLSVIYAALLGLPASAWACLLAKHSRRARAILTAVSIYARCNILKYLPGNVFHFGGRQVLARRAGWAHKDVVLASLLETALLPLAATLVALALLGVATMLGSSPGHDFGQTVMEVLDPTHLVWAICVVAGLAGLGCILALRRGVDPASLWLVAALSMSFFAANAVLVIGLALAAYCPSAADLSVLAAAYLASWSVGFLTPGAPGGIGVREALFVQLATATVPMSSALTLAILARLVTTLGDLWFALGFIALSGPDASVEASGRGK